MPDAHTNRTYSANDQSIRSAQTGDTASPDTDAPATATLPSKPTAAMLAAGARAGNVTVEVAWRVYQAMVTAA